MAIDDADIARLRRWAVEHVPAHVREQVWIEVDVASTSLTVVECRPPWDPNRMGPEPTRQRIARLRFTASRREWTLYWCDHNDRFRRYEPLQPQSSIQRLMDEIDRDPTCIFWG